MHACMDNQCKNETANAIALYKLASYMNVIRVWAATPIRVRAIIRIRAKQGFPAILIWASRTRTGSPYAYGPGQIAHTRMGKIRVCDRTVRCTYLRLQQSYSSKRRIVSTRMGVWPAFAELLVLARYQLVNKVAKAVDGWRRPPWLSLASTSEAPVLHVIIS